MQLETYSEITGLLQKIDKHSSGIKAVFLIEKEIILPIKSKDLRLFLGKQIQIFNNNGKYIILEYEK